MKSRKRSVKLSMFKDNRELYMLLLEAVRAHGGHEFLYGFEQGYIATEDECNDILRSWLLEEIDSLVSFGENDVAERVRSLLDQGKIVDGWRDLLKHYGSSGELTGTVIGCLLRLGRQGDAIDILRTLRSESDGEDTFWWDT